MSLLSDYLWILFESSLNSFMHDYYTFVFLSDLLIWFGQLDCSFLQWERCFVMGSILRCPHPVTVGVARHVFVFLPLRIKIWFFLPYCLDLSLYIMSSCLRRYSVLVYLVH